MTGRPTRRPTVRARVTTAVLLTAALAACGSKTTSSESDAGIYGDADDAAQDAAPAPASGDVGIAIEGFAFKVAAATAGAPISISNADSAAHTVTADDDSFDIEVKGGESGQITIDKAGTYAFHCDIHTSMKGSITVA